MTLCTDKACPSRKTCYRYGANHRPDKLTAADGYADFDRPEGAEKCDDYLTLEKHKPKETIVKLEAGDCIGWNGIAQIVFAVSETKARISTTRNINPLVIDRNVNDIYLTDHPRLSEAERTARLNTLLAAAGSAAGELTKPITADEQTNKPMKTKTEKKPKAAKTPKAAKAPKTPKVKTEGGAESKVSYKGRSKFTKELAVANPTMSVEDIQAACEAQFPGCSAKVTAKLVQKARAALKEK